jgi:putative membrane protein
MPDSPYEKTRQEDTILRDYLATERTVLANERTFLAYLRTALSLMIAGAFLVKFVDNPVLQLLGWAMMPVGGLILIFGAYRFRKVRNRLKRRGQPEPGQDVLSDEERRQL